MIYSSSTHAYSTTFKVIHLKDLQTQSLSLAINDTKGFTMIHPKTLHNEFLWVQLKPYNKKNKHLYFTNQQFVWNEIPYQLVITNLLIWNEESLKEWWFQFDSSLHTTKHTKE